MFWNRPEKNSFRHFKLKMGRNTVKRSFAVCLARYWFSYSVCASGQELASPCSCEKGISHTEGRSWYWSSYIRLGKPQTIYERPSSRRRSCCHKRIARKVETAAAVMRSKHLPTFSGALSMNMKIYCHAVQHGLVNKLLLPYRRDLFIEHKDRLNREYQQKRWMMSLGFW